MKKVVTIPMEVFEALGAYLMNRPMGEVRKLVQEIEANAKVSELPEENQESLPLPGNE